jgi:predicted NBD/HSP70 family sugar kinase
LLPFYLQIRHDYICKTSISKEVKPCYNVDMYLAVDIGGTKTLVATFDAHGKMLEENRFETPKNYDNFILELASNVAKLSTSDFWAGCVAVPGRIDRVRGIVKRCGNLGWEQEPIEADVEKIIHAPVVIENDANLAGLSEARNIKNGFKIVLYVTVSTGIGTGFITNGIIDPELADSEGGSIMLEYQGKMQKWEHIASGSAIVKRFGKRASEIDNPEAWQIIGRNLSLGLIDLIAVLQPEIIIIGGGVGVHFEKYEKPLLKYLKTYENPLVPIPPIREAKRPEEAVIYGCWELVHEKYGKLTR